MIKIKLTIITFIIFYQLMNSEARVLTDLKDPIDSDTDINLDDAMDDLLLTIQSFGEDFLSQMLKKNNNRTTNIAFSPLGISHLFSMLISYTGGNTQAEIREVFSKFGVDRNAEEMDEAFSSLTDYYFNIMLNPNTNIEFHLESIAYTSLKQFKKDFINNLIINYNSVNLIECDNSHIGALSKINQFIARKTNCRIPEFLDAMNDESQIVLANAFYFKSKWKKQFNLTLTDFHNADGTKSKVMMMFLTDKLIYSEDEFKQVIIIPHSGNASMTIYLPKKDKSIDEVENHFKNRESFEGLTYKTTKVNLFIPKMKIEQSIDLKESLREMGIHNLFEKGSANLSGIVDSSDYAIDEIKHEFKLDIDETGVESTGASVISSKFRSNKIVPEVYINRPFVFMIHDLIPNKKQVMSRLVLLSMGFVRKLSNRSLSE